MANWNAYTEAEDLFLIENCIEGGMNYGEAAKQLGRSSSKTIGARIAKLKEIHNFKKNTLQKSPAKETVAESMPTAEPAEDTAVTSSMGDTSPEKPAVVINEEFEKEIKKAEFEMRVKPLPELDELESIPYVAVPTDNSFGEAVHVASVLSDVFHDEVGYFSFAKDIGSLMIDIGNRRISVSEIADDDKV